MATVSIAQVVLESLGLQDKAVTCLSINYGVIAVGTDKNGVYWQHEYLPTDTGWIHIGLDSQSVQTVYAHKSGPLGWAIAAGVDPDTVDSEFIYCSFMGGEFAPNSLGIIDSLTDKIRELDGFPDLTICGETYAAGGRALYRRFFTDSIWIPVYTTSWERYIRTVKAKEEYPGVVLAGGGGPYTGFLLIKSTDYGDTWEDISPPANVFDVDFAGDSADVIFTATFGAIYRSMDGGNNWVRVFGGYLLTEVLYDPSISNVYAAGEDNCPRRAILFVSDDNGDSWQEIPLGTSDPIVDMEFGSNGWIYFVTTNTGIYRFRQEEVGVGKTAKGVKSNTFKLAPNYPNPFNASTTIRYTIPKAGKVVLAVYNILGQEISTLVSQYQPLGDYTIRWDASNVNSGVYFYTLKALGTIQIRKMLVLK